MSAASVKCTATYADGQTLDRLSALIEARSQFLKETGERATKNIMVNAMKSIRARMGTAKKKNAVVYAENWAYVITPSQFTAGWAYPPKKAVKGRRVVRQGGGALDEVNGIRVVNLAGNYTRGERVECFALSIFNAQGAKWYPAKAESCVVIAKSQADVQAFANKRIQRRIAQYSGVSKRLMGIAMHKVLAQQSNAGGELGTLAANFADVRQSGHGFNNGTYSLSFTDQIPNSIRTLKGGEASVSEALEAAANKVQHLVESRIGAELEFEQVPIEMEKAS